MPRQLEIFLTALRLGCLSFGGPVAHLGYFHKEYVERKGWVDEARYSDIVALCQFLPGPASSQVGFAIGTIRSGVLGGLLAWLGFTLPSAILMIAFALGVAQLGDLEGAGWLRGLKIAAVAVVAEAVWKMGAKLCPDAPRRTLALAAAAVLLLVPTAGTQVLLIGLGGVAGVLLLRRLAPGAKAPPPVSADRRGVRVGTALLLVFAVLLVGLPVLATVTQDRTVAVFESFYRAGSLVFGGGHVVLPLLERSVVETGWMDTNTFLAGYGAAQALPGPLFAFSAYLGASLDRPPTGVGGGLLALVAIYLPSWLLVLGVLPLWDRVRARPLVRAALLGA